MIIQPSWHRAGRPWLSVDSDDTHGKKGLSGDK